MDPNVAESTPEQEHKCDKGHFIVEIEHRQEAIWSVVMLYLF